MHTQGVNHDYRSDYPELDQLISAYFNQGFDLWGDTIDEIVHTFVARTGLHEGDRLSTEIDRFLDEHAANLDAVFTARYGFDFSPEAWGHTTRSILREVQRLVAIAPESAPRP